MLFDEEGEGSGMKRAAMIVLAIATLVALGLPSAPLIDHSASFASTRIDSGPGVVAPPTGSGGTVSGGTRTGGGTGGLDQGDADGLSGYKGGANGRVTAGAESAITRLVLIAEIWWKFVIWNR